MALMSIKASNILVSIISILFQINLIGPQQLYFYQHLIKRLLQSQAQNQSWKIIQNFILTAVG